MIELFKNPVTVIFGLLALFFTMMAFGRAWIRKQSHRGDAPKRNPYQVTDPYAEPEQVMGPREADARMSSSSINATPKATHRYFKEFNQERKSSSLTPSEGGAGYRWE